MNEQLEKEWSEKIHFDAWLDANEPETGWYSYDAAREEYERSR